MAGADPWCVPVRRDRRQERQRWSGGEYDDRILRLDPATGRFIQYALPRATNVRRVFVDNSTTPVTFWVGNNHGASIVKLEPLDAPSAPTQAADAAIYEGARLIAGDGTPPIENSAFIVEHDRITRIGKRARSTPPARATST